jgi:hypothetical protein
MDRLGVLLIFFGIVAVVVVVGIRLGMLLAPRIGRWADREAEPPHEDEGADDQ